MMILKKYFREIFIAVLIIVLLISVRSCKVNKDNTYLLTHKADSAFNIATFYKNKDGQLIGQVGTHELTIKQYKNFAEQLGFENKDLKMDNKRLKNLVAHWQAQASMKDTFTVTLHDTTFITDKGSTVTLKDFRWNNNYLSLEGLILSNQITLGYSYDVDFSLTAYHKKRGGFWKQQGQLVADIFFSDPSMKVSTFKGFVIKEERKRWYQTTAFKLGSGFVIGGVVTYIAVK